MLSLEFVIPCDKTSTASFHCALGGLTGSLSVAGIDTDLNPLIKLGSNERSFSAALMVEGNLSIAGRQRLK